jgi:hypothetical protein
MNFSQIFSNFINTGKFSGSTQEARALLDESRSVILDVTRRVESGEIAVANSGGPTASATPLSSKMVVAPNSKSPIFNPPPKPAAVKPTPAPSPKPTPVAAAKSTPVPQEYTEIDRLMGRTKPMKAIQPAPAAKAKPAPPAAPAKAPTPLNDSFAKLGPAARTAYLKAPGNRRALNVELTDAAHAETKAKAAAIAAAVNPKDAAKLAARKSLNS